MLEPLNWGILGAGRHVHRRILPALGQLQHSHCLAIASERAGMAAEVARQHGIPRAYASYEALLADPDVEAVFIPCRGDLHHRWTLAAAAAGKHVLCEKPLATTVEEAEEMANACRARGVLLQEAFMWRHHARARTLRELVRRNAIGELHSIHVAFAFTVAADDWRTQARCGGGALWDLGCYGVNLARFVTGAEPIQLAACSRFFPTGADRTTQLLLEFPAGVAACIQCSFEAPYQCRAELSGTNGRIVLDRAFQPDAQAQLRVWRSAAPGTQEEVIDCPGQDQYAAQCDDFARSVRAGRLLDPAEDGVLNTRVLVNTVAAARSSRKGEATSAPGPLARG